MRPAGRRGFVLDWREQANALTSRIADVKSTNLHMTFKLDVTRPNLRSSEELFPQAPSKLPPSVMELSERNELTRTTHGASFLAYCYKTSMQL